MSFQSSDALQIAIYDRLIADAPLQAIMGAHIYDQLPSGTLPDLFALIGDERVYDRSDKRLKAARHDVTISVVSTHVGYLAAKRAAQAVIAALSGVDLTLNHGQLRHFQFKTSRAKRDTGSVERRIDLIFQAYIDEI